MWPKKFKEFLGGDKIKKQSLLFLITLLFALILAGGASADGTWVNETIDDSVWIQHNSMALDSAGNPHISYVDPTVTDNLLKYAYKDNSGWHNETVDNDLSPDTTSIAVDSSGRPHISYTASNFGHANINYAYKDSSGWHFATPIPGGGGSSYQSSIALDSAGNPHISSVNFVSDGTNYYVYLKYAYFDGSVWNAEDAETIYSGTTNYGYLIYDSLALDSSGNPHISYINPVTGVLRHAYKDGSGWHFETVDSTTGSNFLSTSIAVDSSNNPHIGYSDNLGHLKYASRSGGTWATETVASPGIAIYSPSLDLDSSNNPHILYYSGNLRYASKSGGLWTIEPLNTIIANNVYVSSLALDSAGNPHISYSSREIIDDGSIYYLMYAYFSNPITSVNPTDPGNQPGNSNNVIQVYGATSTTTTVEMQKTGIPVVGLILAILMLAGGFVSSKR